MHEVGAPSKEQVDLVYKAVDLLEEHARGLQHESWEQLFFTSVSTMLQNNVNHVTQWWGVRTACRNLYETQGLDDVGPLADQMCTCAYKDCYVHGQWHNCTCGSPVLTDTLAVASAIIAVWKED